MKLRKAEVTIALAPYANHVMGPLNFSFKFSNDFEELTTFLTSALKKLQNQGIVTLNNYHQHYETWFGVICNDYKILEPIFNEVSKHNVLKVKFLKTGLAGNLDFVKSDVDQIKKVAQKIMERPNTIGLYEI